MILGNPPSNMYPQPYYYSPSVWPSIFSWCGIGEMIGLVVAFFLILHGDEQVTRRDMLTLVACAVLGRIVGILLGITLTESVF